MARILISCGPIPARVDSVKYITNRFKGGLAFKTAQMLSDNHAITIVKWKHTPLPRAFSQACVLDVEDVNDYINAVLAHKYDLYIMAAAVANLTPVNPWEGKFPSHKYKVGEKFNIEFKIADRVIDMIKAKYPRSGLVGYKLFDGPEDELIDAAWKTLKESKANIVFANTPDRAKYEKIAITSDGSEQRMTFDQHISMIDKLANAKYYKTIKNPSLLTLSKKDKEKVDHIMSTLPIVEKRGHKYGTFALKLGANSFITTSRGKKSKEYVIVSMINHSDKIVNVCLNSNTDKATLNAPLLDKVLKRLPEANIVLHGHQVISNRLYIPYAFPGTTEETLIAEAISEVGKAINIAGHGYMVALKDIEHYNEWIHGLE